MPSIPSGQKLHQLCQFHLLQVDLQSAGFESVFQSMSSLNGDILRLTDQFQDLAPFATSGLCQRDFALPLSFLSESLIKENLMFNLFYD